MFTWYGLDRGFALAATGGGLELAGFVDDARKFFNDALGGEALGLGDVDERDVGATEKFFHVVGVATGVGHVVVDAIFEFDGTDGAESALIAEDEVDGLVVDEAVSGVAVLGADFVAEKRAKADFGDDVEFFAKKVVEHLETLLLWPDHEMFAGAIFEAIDSFTLTTAGSNADKN